MNSHPDEDKTAFPIPGHIETNFEADQEVEQRYLGEQPGLTLLEYYVLHCPMPWVGHDMRDDDKQRINIMKLDAENRLEWARSMLQLLRPVKKDAERS